MRLTLFTILLLLLPATSVSQVACNLRVQGYLHFSDDSTAVENAEVFMENVHVKTHTDRHGFFQLKKLCPGEQLLEIDIGAGAHFHYFFSARNDTQLSIYIPRPSIHLHAANVRTKKNTTPLIQSNQIAANAGSNLSEHLQNLPGVQTLKTGNSIGKPVSEGMSGLRLPIFVNGVKQEGQQWGAEHGPEIDLLGYNKVSFVQGAHILMLSHEALGGVIDISGNKEAHSGEFDLTSGAAYATNGRQQTYFIKTVGSPFSKPYTWFANASYRRGGNYQSPNYFLHNTGLEEAGFTTGFLHIKNDVRQILDVSGYHLNAGIFSGASIGSLSDLEAAIKRQQPLYGTGEFGYKIGTPRQNAKHFQLRYEKDKRNSQFFSSLQFDNRREFDYHRTSSKQFPQLDLYLMHLALRKDYNTALLRHDHLQWGWNISISNNQYGGYYFIPDYLSNQSGVYSLATYKFGHWDAVFSARVDYKFIQANWIDRGISNTNTRQFFNAAGAAEFSKKTGQRKITISLFRMWRAPWVNELYSRGVHHGTASYEEGNIDLKVEQDYKLETIFFTEKKWMVFYGKAYFHYIKNYINLSPGNTPVLTVRGAFPAYYYKQFDAIFTGADMELKLRYKKHWEWQHRVSLTYSRDIENHNFPAYIPVPQYNSVISYSRVNAMAHVGLLYALQQPFYTQGTDLMPPPESYFLVNMGFQARNLFHSQRLSLYIDVQNLLNRQYRSYMDRFRYFGDLPGRNIQVRLIFNFHHHNEEIK